ncbi:MAG: Cof-type HAD-IIB family hydrolase [Vulcanimicrobiaceae bacterium]
MSGPPRLLAIDLDGTLVQPRRPLRPRVVAAVRQAQRAGIRTTIVTGRMYVGAKPFAEALALDGPIACYQGAVIADARSGRFASETPLAFAVAARIYAAATAHDFHVQFYTGDQFFVEHRNAYSELYERTSGTQAVLVPSLLERFAGIDPTKVNVVTEIARTAECQALMESVCGDDAYVTRSNPEFVEMLDPRVDKGRAFRAIAEQLGIPLEATIAIGDSYNDLPFLQTAGFGIAMGSAPEELKAAADAVVGDVEHDGVVEAIERYVLGPLAGRAS